MTTSKIWHSPRCLLAGLLVLPLCLSLAGSDFFSLANEPLRGVVHVDASALDLGVRPGALDIQAPFGLDGGLPALCDPKSAAVGVDPLVGVWQRFESDAEGDPIRFYYFHGDGHGLYRYGKVGLTNTHSFDYRIEGERAWLRFRRTGEEVLLPFSVEADPEVEGRSWLTFEGDPRDGEGRYFRDPETRAGRCGSAPGAVAADGLGNRLWMKTRRHAGGGMSFSMYQLQAQTIDGRGVGWFHRGDFDEWTTEALTYRRKGDKLSLHFMLRDESQVTSIELREEREGERVLELVEDPREFWHRGRYDDRGPSFATEVISVMLPVECSVGK
ncbi:MAG TPA: hypothetical protein ENJ18_04145 [Nannocystis exedens]|nr:hypothetical protein [Nannocystis exedens]